MNLSNASRRFMGARWRMIEMERERQRNGMAMGADKWPNGWMIGRRSQSQDGEYDCWEMVLCPTVVIFL